MEQEKMAFSKETSFALKGIAIIMMLMHHMFRTADRFAEFGVRFYPLRNQSIINLAETCKICVAIYAFITGYGLYLSYAKNSGSAQKWVVKRYIQTFSGYWFVWVLSAIVFQLKFHRVSYIMFPDGKYLGIIYTMISFLGLSNLFGTPNMSYHWWYMSAAIVFIALTPYVYKHKNELGMLIMGEILLLCVLFVLHEKSVTSGGQSVYAFIFPFILGHVFARYRIFDKYCAIGNHNYWIKAYKFLAEIWILILLYKFYHNTPRGLIWELHYGVFPMIFIMFCVEFVLCFSAVRMIFCLLGKHSLNIYLMHSLILNSYPKYIYTNMHFFVSVLILLSASLVSSVIIETMKSLLKYNERIAQLKEKIDNTYI